MAQGFTAQISGWVTETESRLEALVKESAQQVVTIMQMPISGGGFMPVRTGFLRASIQASISAPAPIRQGYRPADGQTYQPSMQVSVAIVGMRLGQTLYVTYTAEYARIVEYRPGRGFVRRAAAQWPSIVKKVAADLQARSKGNG